MIVLKWMMSNKEYGLHISCPLSMYLCWMNEWTMINERMNECTMINERMNECTMINERMNEWIKEWMKEWIKEWMNEWMNDEWMNEWMNERIINYRIIEYPCSTCAGRRPAGPCRSCLGRTLTLTPGQQPRPVHQTLDLWFALIAIMYIEPWKPSHAQFEKLPEIIYSCLPFLFFAHQTSIFSFLFPFFFFPTFLPFSLFYFFLYLSSSKASQIILKSYRWKFIQPCFIAISLATM